ncbi:MAG: thiamine-phosphate kinase [Planctomycetota bacterium]
MPSERDFTAWLAELFPRSSSRVPIGIGDDAAVVRNARPQTVAACDPVIEGVHFTPEASPRAVGHKAIHRNLADLAAMGAIPDYLLVSALLPAGAAPARVRALFRGLRDAAAASRCEVVGGDVARTPGPLTLTVTALGHLAGAPLRRSAARRGDGIYVTGPLGGASLGHHLRFAAPLAEGAWLAKQRGVGAVIDVSDGLLLDLQTILVASGGLGAELDEAAIPVSAAARRLTRTTGRPAVEHALADGEDHVLLFTWRRGVPIPRRGPLAAVARQPIGCVVGRRGLWVRGDAAAGLRRVAPAGYQHVW